VCDEDDRIASLDTSLEGHAMSTCGREDDITSDHEEEVAYFPCDDVQDDLGANVYDEDDMIVELDTPLKGSDIKKCGI
jgi:hypothetical protein